MVVNRLTVIATILSPSVLVSGLFGMNVPVPGQDSGSLWWFFGIVGCMIILTLIIIVIVFARMRRKKQQ